MTKLKEQLKQGVGQAWESLSEGWRELGARAGSALTRFRPATPPDSGAAAQTEAPPLGAWAVLAADVLDADDRIVVRIEAPGMQREDFQVELNGDLLSVRGDKRWDIESDRGRYRMLQCAYGSFRREVALPVPVQAERTKATYRDGVLRIDLPKAPGVRARRVAVRPN